MSKKNEAPEKPPLLGRPSNNLRMGVVGLPNVGKSTLFNVLCKMQVPAENFPFCTVDPNISQVAVPDERFDELVKVWNPKSRVPAVLHVTDIAGLVKGAAQGEGLGNAFLSHIKAVDGIYHVVRIFDIPEVTHVEDSIDPVRDLDIISHELRAKDLELMTNMYQKWEKDTKHSKVKSADGDVYKRIIDLLEAGKDVRNEVWNAKEVDIINPLTLLTAKPVVYLVNMDEQGFIKKQSKWFKGIKDWVDSHGGGTIIPFCGEWEGKLLKYSDAELAEYLKSTKCTSMLPKIIKTGYACLHLINFFTTGPDEVRGWTIREGTLAPQAAGVIHTDFEKGFVCAEIYSYQDWVECEKNEDKVKASGKYIQRGKTHAVKDGDIIFFKCNTVGLQKAKKK